MTSTQSSPLVTSSGATSTLASSINADLPIATASADVAADIAKYTSKVSASGHLVGGRSEDPLPDGCCLGHDLPALGGCLGGQTPFLLRSSRTEFFPLGLKLDLRREMYKRLNLTPRGLRFSRQCLTGRRWPRIRIELLMKDSFSLSVGTSLRSFSQQQTWGWFVLHLEVTWTPSDRGLNVRHARSDARTWVFPGTKRTGGMPSLDGPIPGGLAHPQGVVLVAWCGRQDSHWGCSLREVFSFLS